MTFQFIFFVYFTAHVFFFFASLILVINILQVDGLIKTELFQLSYIVVLILIHDFDKFYNTPVSRYLIPSESLSQQFFFQTLLRSKDHIRITYDKILRKML